MRPDFKKVIVERPRAGGGLTSGRREIPWITKLPSRDIEELRELEFDNPVFDAPKHGKIKQENYDRKSQTDLLGPLIRFLEANVGRPWDDVWSEVCRVNKGHMGQHVRDHILLDVRTDIAMEAGGIFYDDKGKKITSFGSRTTFYVNPVDGILCRRQGKGWKHPRYPKKIVELEGEQYYRHLGIWYWVRTEKFRPESFSQYDVFGNRKIPKGTPWGDYYLNNHLSKTYGMRVVCVEKRQVSKKICRKLNRLVEGKIAA